MINPQSIILKTGNQVINLNNSDNIKSIYLGSGESDINSIIDFIYSTSEIKTNVDIKIVLTDKAKLSLNCKLIIPKNIKFIEGFLRIKVLILSQDARVSITPCLEIHENDVKCGHALAIGVPDRNHIEYLISRGLDLKQAIQLIVDGFLNN